MTTERISTSDAGACAPTPEQPNCHFECRQVLIDGMAAMGTEVNVSHVPPPFDPGYEPLKMLCPHGVLWFMEPTSEQRLRYAEERVL